jgi:hypothetical protein
MAQNATIVEVMAGIGPGCCAASGSPGSRGW